MFAINFCGPDDFRDVILKLLDVLFYWMSSGECGVYFMPFKS